MLPSRPYQGRLFPNLTPFHWFLAILAACIIAMLSLGAHDLAIAHLGIPYPDESSVPAWAKFTGQFLRIAATVYFCRLASWCLDRQAPIAAAMLVGLIVVFFHETIRVLVIENVLVEGWVDHRWIYMGAQRLPGACLSFFWGASALVIARRLAGKGILVFAAAVLVATAVGYFGIRPGVAEAGSLLIHARNLTEPAELYQLPYGLYVYSFIYSTFIEPTMAMFLIVWLAWPGLKGSPARRIGLLAVLALVMRGRVIATFLFSFWIKQPRGMAVAAEGQFFIETLILATLTGCTWHLLVNKRQATHEGLPSEDGPAAR